MLRTFALAFVIAQATAGACGSTNGTTTTTGTTGTTTGTTTLNTQTIVVNDGPDHSYFNGAFTSVLVCVPGQSTCQVIDGILVDTGSSGLRILASALTLSLPQQADATG